MDMFWGYHVYTRLPRQPHLWLCGKNSVNSEAKSHRYLTSMMCSMYVYIHRDRQTRTDRYLGYNVYIRKPAVCGLRVSCVPAAAKTATSRPYTMTCSTYVYIHITYINRYISRLYCIHKLTTAAVFGFAAKIRVNSGPNSRGVASRFYSCNIGIR